MSAADVKPIDELRADKAIHTEADAHEALRQLLCLIDQRLFGTFRWLPKEDTIQQIDAEFLRLGLEQAVPGSPGALETTPLGKDLNLHLVMCFLGTWVEWNIPIVLNDQDFLNDEELDEILEQLGNGACAEKVLRPHVTKAYFSYYRGSQLRQ